MTQTNMSFRTQLHRHVVTLLACAAMLQTTPALTAGELSKEGRDHQAIHDYPFDTFDEGRQTAYQGIRKVQRI